MLLILLPCEIPVKIAKVNLLWGNSDQVVKVWHNDFICYVATSCSGARYFYFSSKDRKDAFDINVKSVHVSCQGTGLTGITKIAGLLHLPLPSHCKSNNILKTSINQSINQSINKHLFMTKEIYATKFRYKL